MSARDSIPAYFLTRHHANLMQGLARVAATGGSLSILHGAAGVGKSRLLRAFIDFHVRDHQWLLIEFLPQGLFLLKAEGLDQTPRPQHELGAALESMDSVDLWLVDGFELALDHGREQLHQAWSRVSPRPARVVAGQLSWPEQWRLLLPSREGPLHEAGLKPLDLRESEAYLSNRLCPQPGMELVIDRHLRRAIRATCGRVAELDSLADRLASPVCRPFEVSRAFRGKALFWGLLAIPLLGLALWVGVFNREAPRATLAGPAEQAVKTAPAPVPVPAESAPPEGNVVAAIPPGAAESRVPTKTRIAPPRENERIEKPAVAAETPVQGSPPQEEAKPSATVASSNTPVTANPWPAPVGLGLLNERLTAMWEWLNSAEASGYRIQLMTVGGSETSARALDAYLRKLVSRGIPVDRLWVYHGRDERHPEGYYGLLYGRYADRKAAARARELLPKVLRVKRPLLRSLDGLRRETGIGSGA